MNPAPTPSTQATRLQLAIVLIVGILIGAGIAANVLQDKITACTAGPGTYAPQKM